MAKDHVEIVYDDDEFSQNSPNYDNKSHQIVCEGCKKSEVVLACACCGNVLGKIYDEI